MLWNTTEHKDYIDPFKEIFIAEIAGGGEMVTLFLRCPC